MTLVPTFPCFPIREGMREESVIPSALAEADTELTEIVTP